jgi:hypothetical protein
MKKAIVFLVFLSPFVFFFSCTHETILPEQEVSFQHDIYPIILSGCEHSGCHDTLGSGGIPMIDYASVMSNNRIIPGNPKGSKLYQNIIGIDDQMPKLPYGPLSDQQIRYIYIWIAQGAKDN